MKRKEREGTSYETIKRYVIDKDIKKSTFESMLEWLLTHRLNLWGEEQGRNFAKKNLLVWLWKDLNAYGTDFVEEETRPWLKIVAKSINHNSDAIRSSLQDWAIDIIRIGNVAEWKFAARHAKMAKAVDDMTLLIDSSDFSAQRKMLDEY